jgi:hypothetical protein
MAGSDGASLRLDEPDEPPEAAKQSEVPGLETALAKDQAYRSLFSGPRTDLNEFLSYLSQLIITNQIRPLPDRQNETVRELASRLKEKKLEDSALKVYMIFARVAHLPEDFAKQLCAHLSATKSEPNLGTWTLYKQGSPIHDYSALAAWAHPRNPAYVRAFLAARPPYSPVRHPDGSGSLVGRQERIGPFGWSAFFGHSYTMRSWLLLREHALQHLGKLTKLTSEEEKHYKDLEAWNASP